MFRTFTAFAVFLIHQTDALVSSSFSSSSLKGSLQSSKGQVTDVDTPGGQTSIIAAGPPSESESMSFLLNTLNKFRNFAYGSKRGVEERHQAEQLRLYSSMNHTQNKKVQLALMQSVTTNTKSLSETERVYSNMISFSDSMMNLLKAATSKGYGCEQTTCGEHASCTDTTMGAQCVCNEGYVGLGYSCAAPPNFLAHRFLYEGLGGSTTMATEMHVCSFAKDLIGAVFRDMSKSDIGRVVIARVRAAGMAVVSPPEQFNPPSTRAFNPVIDGSDNKRILIGWRDENRRGVAYVIGAAMGTTGIRGADMALTWGSKQSVAESQTHKMALIHVGNDRFALMFADKIRATQHTPSQSFGNSLVARVTNDGNVAVLGKYRWSDVAVTRLEVSRLSQNSFILAVRSAKNYDEMDSGNSSRQEAIAYYGEAVDDNLAFDPTPVNLEPSGSQIWARSVAKIAPDTFAYAYQDGTNMQMKIAVIRKQHGRSLRVLQKPVPLRSGFTPYLSMLSEPYTESDPHTLAIYQVGNASMASVCSWIESESRLDHCQEYTWMNSSLTSLSGIHLGGGKALMAFTPASGTPMYSVFGLAKK